MSTKIITIVLLSLCLRAEAQITLEPMYKIGFYGYTWKDRLNFEPNMQEDIRWRHGLSLHIPEWHLAIDMSFKTKKNAPFGSKLIKLGTKPGWRGNFDTIYNIGDTVIRSKGYSNWVALSVNAFPKKWRKHRLLVGMGLIEREGGIEILEGHIGNLREPILKGYSFNQKTMIYKAEYIFMPFKYFLFSINFDYARFKIAPKDYYGLTVSVGSYFDYTIKKK